VWTLNGSHGNDRLIRVRLGEQAITLNPLDAAERGLCPGDLARVSNDVGELVMVTMTSSDVPRSVALSPKGRWPKFEPEGGNVNVLNPGGKTDMGDSSMVHGIEVLVTPVARPEPAEHVQALVGIRSPRVD
jgi:anaerobic selenocysteine-containing dehydrogenase